MKSFVYVLYLITVPDILDLDKRAVHRHAFENQETCIDLAHTLGQELDPISRKQQCQTLEEYDLANMHIINTTTTDRTDYGGL